MVTSITLMDHFRQLNIALLYLLLVNACTGKETRNSHAFESLIENGITIAKTTGGPKFDTELFQYTEVLRLNQDVRIAESLLAYPQYFLMDDRGWFFVVHYKPYEIICFDSNGNYSHTIGREGDGPGEFRSLELIEIHGDTLVVIDYFSSRISKFLSDGPLIEMVTVDRPETGKGYGYSLTDYDEIDGGVQLSIWRFGKGDKDFSWTGLYLTSSNQNGEELFSIETPLIREWFNTTTRGVVAGGALPFAGKPVIALQPDGRLLRTTGKTPEIDIFSKNGELVGRYVINLPFESSTAYEKDIRAHFIKRARKASNEFSRTVSLALLDNLYIPEFIPFWADVFVDDNGYVWLVNPDAVYGPTAEQSKLRVLSPEGEYLGDTEWPTRNARVSHGHLLTIQTNERSGVEDLIVYEIKSRVRGLEYPN